MYRVRPRWLLESLRSIKRNQPVNVIKVDDDIKNKSLIALEQMLRVLS